MVEKYYVIVQLHKNGSGEIVQTQFPLRPSRMTQIKIAADARKKFNLNGVSGRSYWLGYEYHVHPTGTRDELIAIVPKDAPVRWR